jgi:hypothetical protein
MGLVGLLLMDPRAGPPRAAGMKGVIVGYVVSHPALGFGLSTHRDGHLRPILAFRMNIVLVKAQGMGGLEETRGRGELDVFYDAAGFDDSLLRNPRVLENDEEVEADAVEFRGSIDFDTYRFYMRVHETAMTTQAFTFDGRRWRTPAARTAWDVMVGEYSDGFVGVAFASNNALFPLSPEEKLISLAGARTGATRY